MTLPACCFRREMCIRDSTYAVGEGNKAEAVRLLQELEIHSLIPRFGLDGIAPAAPEEEDGIELAEAELEALPLAPSGTYLVASRPAVMGKQGTVSYTHLDVYKRQV